MNRYVLFALPLLAGCVTEMPATQAQLQKLGETCQAYGFKPGSDAFAACIFQLDQQRIAQARQTRQAIGAALSEAGDSMQRSAYANRPINCTSTTGIGGITRTNCY